MLGWLLVLLPPHRLVVSPLRSICPRLPLGVGFGTTLLVLVVILFYLFLLLFPWRRNRALFFPSSPNHPSPFAPPLRWGLGAAQMFLPFDAFPASPLQWWGGHVSIPSPPPPPPRHPASHPAAGLPPSPMPVAMAELGHPNSVAMAELGLSGNGRILLTMGRFLEGRFLWGGTNGIFNLFPGSPQELSACLLWYRARGDARGAAGGSPPPKAWREVCLEHPFGRTTSFPIQTDQWALPAP